MKEPPGLVVDLGALQVEGYAGRGVGRYAAGHVQALAAREAVVAALVSPELPPPANLPAVLVQDDLLRWNCLSEARRLTTGDRRLALYVPAPFLHSGPGEPAALGVARHWADLGLPRVVTLHDLIPLRAPGHYLAAPGHEERYRRRARWVAAADLVLTNSAHTRGEAIELLGCSPGSVVEVGAGVAPYFSPPDGSDRALVEYHLPGLGGRPYVMTVGGSDERKNMERLVDALGLLTGRGWDLALVVVGDLTAGWRRRLEERAAGVGLAGRLHLTGAVTDDVLRACYRHAVLSAMPSLAEGSGLPVLESAACGTAALASATTALVETSATPLARFEPTEAESIAEAISRLAADDVQRSEVLAAQQRLAAGSTWEAVADRTLAAVADLEARTPPGRWRAARPGPTLGLAGPLPPLGGGIGVYNRRLLDALPRGVRAAAVVPGTTIPDVPRTVLYRPMDACGQEFVPSSWDGVVYTLGNSEGHLQTVEMALAHPGWVWLHETRLPAVATTALSGLADEEFDARLAALLHRAYPGRAPLGAARRAGRSNLALLEAGVGLAGLLAERARGLLVNSQLARRMLELDLAPLAWRPPIHVLPPACPPVAPVGSGSRDPRLVVALGVVTMSKRPDLLVDAMVAVEGRLVFVGPCPPILDQVIRERAALRGVSDRVDVVGSVGDGEWAEWMAHAALAVQLRDVSGGETSAAVLEAMAAGLPVVTNVASAGEYPSGSVAFFRGLDVEDVARRVNALLASPGARADLARGGAEFAGAHTFAHLARHLLGVVSGGVG